MALEQTRVDLLLRIAAILVELPHQPGKQRPALLAARRDASDLAVGSHEGIDDFRLPIAGWRVPGQLRDLLWARQPPGESRDRIGLKCIPARVGILPLADQAEALEHAE